MMLEGFCPKCLMDTRDSLPRFDVEGKQEIDRLYAKTVIQVPEGFDTQRLNECCCGEPWLNGN